VLSGGPAPAPRHATIVDALVAAARGTCGLVFVALDEREERVPWADVAAGAARAAGAGAALSIIKKKHPTKKNKK
jgi:hypothetical protein